MMLWLTEERRQRDIDIQNQVLLKTLTFNTKTILKSSSKTSKVLERS